MDSADLQILQSLSRDARRSYSDIGDTVGLPGADVSDRIDRLLQSEIIERFTVQVDRSRLHVGVPVLLDIEVETANVDYVRQQLRDATAVEHVFTTADSGVVVTAYVAPHDIRRWLTETVNEAYLESYDVTVLSAAEWTPTVDANAFTRRCAHCGDTVTGEGGVESSDGSLYYFCGSSCRQAIEQEHGSTDHTPSCS